MSVKNILVVGSVLVSVAWLTGCGKPAAEGPAKEPAASVAAEEGHSPDGWWCNEHGVPEEVCTRCDPKLVAEFKAKGDWCKQHDRPDSQCFVCHPEKEAELAADYEARYGKTPPKPDGT